MSYLDREWTKILGWPGYRVYRHEINEKNKTLKLWVRRKSGNQKLLCGGCGQRVHEIREIYEREVRDLPWGEYQVTVVIELYRVECSQCGIKTEKVDQLPSKAPFSKRFEDAVGEACESATGAPGSVSVRAAGTHGGSDRSAVFGTLGGAPQKAGVAADGSG